MRHTSGPWRVVKTGKPTKHVYAGDELIASVRHFYTGTNERGQPAPGQAKANATLIAAAPDLLSACENALQLLDPWDWPALFMQLENAVAKARGNADPTSAHAESETP